MKRIISLLLCTLIIMTSMCIIASASSNGTVELEVNGIEYTIEFEDSAISEEKKTVIANALLGINESEIMPANIWCDLFGHDYQYTVASAVQHKASSTAPRCKKQTYDVTYCEDCDYTQQTLVAVNYIYCCPEE